MYSSDESSSESSEARVLSASNSSLLWDCESGGEEEMVVFPELTGDLSGGEGDGLMPISSRSDSSSLLSEAPFDKDWSFSDSS